MFECSGLLIDYGFKTALFSENCVQGKKQINIFSFNTNFDIVLSQVDIGNCFAVPTNYNILTRITPIIKLKVKILIIINQINGII